MIKITNLNEIQKTPFPALKAHIEQKVQGWIDEYGIKSLDEIGCFVILNADEKEFFQESEMEFTETIHLEHEIYLHGTVIWGDCYGADIFLPVEEVR